jgi:hypothetical protein
MWNIRLLFFVLILASCSQPRYVYNPPARNLHYFNGKGESVVTASWSTGPSRNDQGENKNYNHGGDIQAAYAFADHWAILAGFHHRAERDLISDRSTNFKNTSDIQYKRSGWEIGTSYFLPLDQRKFTFFYIDGGAGFTKNTFDDRSFIDSVNVIRNFSNNGARYFLQPGIYTGTGAVRFNIGLRFQYSRFSRQETNYTEPELMKYSLSGLQDITTYEPYISFQFGTSNLPWVKAIVQVSTASINKGFYIRNSYAMIGLNIYPLARK